MKTYFHAYAMCQSMFCAIPCPWKVWDPEAKDKMLLFLPLVGLEMGLLWAGLAWLTQLLAVPALFRGLAVSVFPWLVTGFIHLDGFMDVTDAVGSWRSPERRREILKDSHVGSFAVIGIALVLLTQFVLCACVPETGDFRILIFIPALSRCCSALAVTGLPSMQTSQYFGQKKASGKLWFLGLLLAAILAAGFLLCGRSGFCLVGCLAGYGLSLRKAYRSLEGMNGDISGYALTLGELSALAVYTLI